MEFSPELEELYNDALVELNVSGLGPQTREVIAADHRSVVGRSGERRQ
ncbi:MAG TPA: hypothetical protein VKM54_15725 [Myxococcota bacterium]|nr:hypothetical protein [Myxococcota bacterium]